MNKKSRKAVVLLSGGLDSATTLAYAQARGYESFCLIFDYGQRHAKEIRHAKRIAHHFHRPYQVIKIRLPWHGSALLDKKVALPRHRVFNLHKIPPTYVPARNIIFLSFAASFAEVIGATRIFIGANAIDYSGYPDCRPNFYAAYQTALNRGLKSGVEGHRIKIVTPLIHKTKAQIIRLGMKLKVPYRLTWSCYSGGRKPCGTCDSCRLREKGFQEAGTKDGAPDR